MKTNKSKSQTSLAYSKLGNEKRVIIRDSFLKEFDYTIDTFYKKIRGTSPLKTIEKKWLCKKLKITSN